MIAIAVCLLLAWVIVEDMRRFKVRNLSVIMLAACFPLDCLLRGRLALLAPHALFAGLGLAVLICVFVARMLGGGDAKLLSAALLWVGPEGCFVFALVLLACTSVYSVGARFGWLPSRTVKGRMVIPFGPSIALAWMAHIALTASL